MAVIGSDIQQMSALQSKFTSSSSHLDGIASTLKTRVNSVNWTGPDANQFKGQDLSQILANITAACGVLHQGATDLGRNITEQQGASNG
jgi:hypothetical protein